MQAPQRAAPTEWEAGIPMGLPHWWPTPKLPTFDSTGSVQLFLVQYAIYAAIQQLTEKQMTDLLSPNLAGEAADWYAREVRGNQPASWQDLASHFTLHYGGC